MTKIICDLNLELEILGLRGSDGYYISITSKQINSEEALLSLQEAIETLLSVTELDLDINIQYTLVTEMEVQHEV